MENARRWLASRKEHAEKTVLIVEDEDALAALFVYIISMEKPFHPLVASDVGQALNVVDDQHIDLCILEHRPSRGLDGIALYDQLQDLIGPENVPTIIVSANLPQEEIARRKIIGVPKPFHVDDVIEIIHTLLA